MYQKPAQHPLSETVTSIDESVFSAMWEIFVHIGKYWKNMEDPSPYRSQLYSFMLNRIKLRPLYNDYYFSAMNVMSQLIEERGEEQAYVFLFTDPDAAITPPETALALTRQFVANEFMALQLSLGGFKAFGALNYCGYIGGANIPGQPVPYRTFED